MSRRVAYVNGAYAPMTEASVSIEDRGLQFADSIYEVWGVRGGALRDTPGHLARLARSLKEVSIPAPMSDAALMVVLRETTRRNRVRDGVLYLQISRGAAPRDHPFPPPETPPTIIVTAKTLDLRLLELRGREGVRVITQPETRWARCDIKSVNLLPNVLAKEAARQKAALEAWFVDDDGYVTEGAASTAWIVDKTGRLITPPLSNHILPGVTRARVLDLAQERQIAVEQRSFTCDEAFSAREAMLTSATNGPVPIVALDGRAIGEGRPGPIVQMLRDAYFGAEAPKS
jgi:D-alanine transaminase